MMALRKRFKNQSGFHKRPLENLPATDTHYRHSGVEEFVAVVVMSMRHAYHHKQVRNREPEAGGTYTLNHTLYYQDGPYKVTKPILIQAGAVLTIEQGVQLYFASGVGVVVQGVLQAVGNKYVQIDFLPWRTPIQELEHESSFPNLRLVDGPSTRQGRLQVLHNGRWRAVCTMMTK
ncbi:conserved hypothetical protein [Trichinella spiralis]|uniref:hypothetical protein n=1 Tax=Trichinella spiralis TaxID=6334 RepID=UPI0001EFC0E7|nr:conserved hypothetical protein [Trichinella spiralis]